MIYSKLLPYTCYELGHTWHPSCTKCSIDMFISSANASLKIYAVVYLLTILLSKKKISKSNAWQILKNYLRSVLFLSINGLSFVGIFCLLRKIFRHFNFFTVSWLPSFIGSFFSILIERESRRSMLAIYVSNVASESFWNVLKSQNLVRPIMHGEVFIFAASMALFGYYFKFKTRFSPMIQAILRFLIGSDESTFKAVSKSSIDEKESRSVKGRSPSCSHQLSCFMYASKGAMSGMVKGYLTQFAIKLVLFFPKIAKNPLLILKISTDKSLLRVAAFFGWFSAAFKITCCACRATFNEDKAIFGALAGGMAALGMIFQPSKTLAIYSFWKALEVLWNEGMDKGYLPRIPYGIEILYSFSTAYLFHLSALNHMCLKPTYWHFLMRLSNGRINEFNRTLLQCYDAPKGVQDWPNYNAKFLSERFIKDFVKS